MTDDTLPRWQISYRPKLGTEVKTLTIPAESMVAAIKQAQMQLAEMDGGPFRIVMVEGPATETPPPGGAAAAAPVPA